MYCKTLIGLIFSDTAWDQIRAEKTQVHLLMRIREKRLLPLFRPLSYSGIIWTSYGGNSPSTGWSSLIYCGPTQWA